LLWNDDPLFEPAHEQFFGLIRSRLELPKPAYADTRLVMRTIRRLSPVSGVQAAASPFGYVVVSRMAMDCGITHGPLDPLTARELDLRVVTDFLVERNELDVAHRMVIVADDARVSSAAFVTVLLENPQWVIAPATIGRFGVDGDAAREAVVSALLGLSPRRFEIIANARIHWVAAPVGDRSDGWYSFEQSVERAVIDDDELATDCVILARFEDGLVAVFSRGHRVITAFGLGADGKEDPERTRLARDLTRSVAQDAGILRPVRSIDRDDPVLVYDLGSGMVAVVNTSDIDRVASIDLAGRLIEIPVAARHFSAWDHADRQFAVISGPGTLRDDGQAVLTTPDNVTVVFDEGSIEVRPRYHDGGGRQTEALADGVRLGYQMDDASGYFAGPAALPLSVEVLDEPTIRCRADLERYVALAPHGNAARGAYVQLAVPDACRILWTDAPEGVDRFEIELIWHERLGKPKRHRLSAIVRSRAGLIEFDPPTITPPAAVQIEVRAFGEAGVQVPVPPARLQLAYRDRDLPSMSYRTGEAKIGRILHPLRYEDCSIVDVRAEAFSEGRWRHLALNIGGPGQHARHLELSEEWQELIL
jgi:hypothetical protein